MNEPQAVMENGSIEGGASELEHRAEAAKAETLSPSDLDSLTPYGITYRELAERMADVQEGRGIPHDEVMAGLPSRVAALIAILNAALPDSDPRKITREHVSALRDAVGALQPWCLDFERYIPSTHTGWRLAQLADALESYLPPET